MNKTKKIAFAAVSVVMAGTMAVGMFGCGSSNTEEGNWDSVGTHTFTNADTLSNPDAVNSGNAVAPTMPQRSKPTLLPTVDGDGKLTWTAETELKMSIIDSGSVERKISYDASQMGSQWTGVDGKNYKAGDLKPAWVQFGQNLNLTFKDVSTSGRGGTELSSAKQNNELAGINFINCSASEIMSNTDILLNLADYLEYMPNYKKFLDQNAIVQYSLTMAEDGSMYYIPYFDGNDDIEKYELVQRTWTKKVLDDANPIDSAVTFKAQAEAKKTNYSAIVTDAATAGAFMGKVAADNWYVKTTDPANTANTIYVTLRYDKVIEALGDTSKGLGKAVAEALPEGTNPSTESGNIVDIQNQVINAKAGEVTGAQLAKILREYIKVAYYKSASWAEAPNATTQMYGVGDVTLADVFIESWGAWDADLMTAMYRCVVTNYDKFPGVGANAKAEEFFALAGREMKAQRENDLIALAGELYGVRGLESRLEYTYINSKGALADARTNPESYEAAANLNALAKEGLLYNIALATSTTVNKYWATGKVVAYMLHDYAQTQTQDGYKNRGIVNPADDTEKLDNKGVVSAEYDFAPIVTPVSRWDTNDDGKHETVMRFTESWRSVKNTGVAIPKASIGEDANKLAAVLGFIDYLYSNDGQIVGSYGSYSSTGDTNPNGFWYGNPVTATIGGVTVSEGVGDLAALKAAGVVDTVDGKQYYIANTAANAENYAKYFMYNNKIYTGMAYKDRQIPLMTSNNVNFYYGFTVGASGKMKDGSKLAEDAKVGIIKNYALNYTNYARGIVGAALPIGNKDQGFEYQCTAPCGLQGAARVSVAINNGTIKHVTQSIYPANWWYTEASTCLPTTVSEATFTKNQVYLDGTKSSVGIFNPTSTAGYSNVYIDLAFRGFEKGLKIGTNFADTGDYDMQPDAASLVTYISEAKDNGLTTRLGYYRTAWGKLRTLYAPTSN